MSTTSFDVDAAARRYLDEAEGHLVDLPARDRGELLSDIADAIAELSDDAAGDYDQLVARLGSPEEFAREIRRSAGATEADLADTPVTDRVTPPTPIRVVEPVRFDEPAVLDTPSPRFVALGSSALRWVGSEFEPVWWLVRAFIVAGLAVVLFGTTGTGFLVLASIAILALSIGRGIVVKRRRAAPESHAVRTARGLGVIVLGGAALLFMLAAVTGGGRFGSGSTYVDSYAPVTSESSATSGLATPNGDVNNVYAFDAAGNRINDVRLYDQNGNPLDVASATYDSTRRQLRDVNDTMVFNAFPIRYFDPGTDTVSDPDAGWPASPGPVTPSAPTVATSTAPAASEDGAAVAAAATPAVSAASSVAEPVAPAAAVAPAVRAGAASAAARAAAKVRAVKSAAAARAARLAAQ
jgi:hypothetical protein